MTSQSAISTGHTEFARFITFDLHEKTDLNRLRIALAQLPRFIKMFHQQFPECRLGSAVAIGPQAFAKLYPHQPQPDNEFPKLTYKGKDLPVTPSDLLLHIRCDRKDITYEYAMACYQWLKLDCNIKEDTEGFRYFAGRDLTGFVGHDGKSCPAEDALKSGAIGDEGPLQDGSYVHIQKFCFDLPRWQGLPESEQELVIGRGKRDNQKEISDKQHPPHIHRVRLSGNDLVRAGIPFGNLQEQGHFFLSYSNNPRAFGNIMGAMVAQDENGDSDPLLRYAKSVTGAAYFAPSVEFLVKNSF